MEKPDRMISRERLLAQLRDEVEETFQGLMEDIHYYVDGDYDSDWEPVSDDTPQEELPLLIDHESKLVQTLARHRLAGESVSSEECRIELYHMVQKAGPSQEGPLDTSYKAGRLYQISRFYEILGEEEMSKHWRKWGFFDPSND